MSKEYAEENAKKQYKPRTTIPSRDNVYFRNNVFENNGYGMWANNGNCTAYAYGRFQEVLGTKKNCKLATGNAGVWYGNTTEYKKGSTPALGAVACWGKSGGRGHVAIVEKVFSNGDFYASESAYHLWLFRYRKHTKNSRYLNQLPAGYYFQGFIYNPGGGESLGGDGTENDDTPATSINVQQRAAKLISSDSYAFITAQSKETNSGFSLVSSLKSAFNAVVGGIKSGLSSLVSLTKSTLSVISDGVKNFLLPANAQQTWVIPDTSFVSNLKKTIIVTTPKIARQQAQLLISENVVEAPFIELTIGNQVIGSYKGSLDVYPNYISSLQVSRQNGIINQYTINLIHQIRPGEDVNSLDEVLSVVGYGKIGIKYGDANTNLYFQDFDAIITNIRMNRNYTSMNISYTIEATSAGELINTYVTNFPAKSAKPSTVLTELFYSGGTVSDILLQAFPGMKNKNFVFSNNLIPVNDSVVNLDAQTNANILDYINYLIGCMSNELSGDELIRQSTYYSAFVDSDPSNPDGAYIKVKEVKADISPYTSSNKIYNLAIGYKNDIVYDFTVESTNSWELLYKNSKSSKEYFYTVLNNGDTKKEYSPSITSSITQLSELNKNWWTQMVKFPISASLTIKGLLKPVMLMDYIDIDVMFYGQKHITSGIYVITGQTDYLSATGYRTTLSLIRVGNA